VAEVGRHEDLLKSNGVYARLYAVNYGLTPGRGAVSAPADDG
jgi:hypothetical protein